MLRLLFAASLAATAPPPIEITAPGPEAPLAGTLIETTANAPLVLIVPGSGPTDRDGNNPLGVAGGPYRQLAEALAARGIASVRIDKRGLAGSAGAVADGNAVTTADYADDVHSWAKAIARRTGRSCIWVLGHSEGGLVALQAAQHPEGLCGLILVSAAGRSIGAVMREQLRANPANAPILNAAMSAIDSLEAGKRIASAGLPAPLKPLFREAVQGYLIDLFSHDPVKLIGAVSLPVLIVQGDRDLQVSVADAEALHRAQPTAELRILPGVNHVLRPVADNGRAANIATYGDATLAISPAVADTVATFVAHGIERK